MLKYKETGQNVDRTSFKVFHQSKKKYITFKFFGFQELFVICLFLLKLTHLEKTERKISFIPQGLFNDFIFVFRRLQTFAARYGCWSFLEMNTTSKSTSNSEKSNQNESFYMC